MATVPSLAMQSIKLSCEQNNQGVALLTSGDSQGAMAAFQISLASIKQLVNFAEDEDEEESSSDIGFSQGTPKGTIAIHESTAGLPMLISPYSYVYDRPLLLQPPQCQDLDAILAMFSAIILFNLALTCHSAGCTGRESALKRATVLYRMSIQLLQNCATCGSAPLILSILALNNRAQIHYEHCDYVQSKHCLKEMSRVMLDTQSLYTALPEKDVEGLLLNVMLLETPTAAQAA